MPETAQVYLKDLPEAFDGVTVLLLTDLHVGAFASGDETAGLMDELQNLYPDLLLLGAIFPERTLLLRQPGGYPGPAGQLFPAIVLVLRAPGQVRGAGQP